MKTLKGDACDTKLQGETFDAWFEAAHEHYMKDHADIMESMKDKPKSEAAKWMAEAKKRFEAA